MSKNWITLCDEIDDGVYDDGLAEMVRTINSRRDVVTRRKARRLALSLEVKDKVVLTNGIKPKYLDGTTGHVVEIRGDSAIVMLDSLPSHAGRPSKGRASRRASSRPSAPAATSKPKSRCRAACITPKPSST